VQIEVTYKVSYKITNQSFFANALNAGFVPHKNGL